MPLPLQDVRGRLQFGLKEDFDRYPRTPEEDGALLEGLPTSFSTPELNVKCAEGEPHALVEQLIAKASFAAPATINTIDGVRVDWPDGFGLIRASNTTPVLVLRFEGHTPEALHRIEADMPRVRSVKSRAESAYTLR